MLIMYRQILLPAFRKAAAYLKLFILLKQEQKINKDPHKKDN